MADVLGLARGLEGEHGNGGDVGLQHVHEASPMVVSKRQQSSNDKQDVLVAVQGGNIVVNGSRARKLRVLLHNIMAC